MSVMARVAGLSAPKREPYHGEWSASRPVRKIRGRRGKRRGPGAGTGASLSAARGTALEVHAAHAAHATHAAARRHRRGRFLRTLGDHRLGGDQQARDRGGILQGAAYDLGRIDYPFADEIAVLA